MPKANTLFSVRIFTATLGGKNSLTRRQVFSNVAEKGHVQERLEKYLLYLCSYHLYEIGKDGFCLFWSDG